MGGGGFYALLAASTIGSFRWETWGALDSWTHMPSPASPRVCIPMSFPTLKTDMGVSIVMGVPRK